MRGIAAFLILTVPLSAWQQSGLSPKVSVEEFEKFSKDPLPGVGLNYMGRSFSAEHLANNGKLERATFDAGQFLVLEVGIFPEKGKDVKVQLSDFTLYVNGAKFGLKPVAAQSLGLQMKYREANMNGPRVVGGVGVGDATVGIGQPLPSSRFPGDPRPGQRRQPTAMRIESEGIDPAKSAVESSLPEGLTGVPRCGNLYFDVPGKLSKIKSLVLVYENLQVRHELKLR